MCAERILDLRQMEQPEPLLRALAALSELATGDFLRLLSHRDPVLLYSMLTEQGFAYARLADHAETIEVLIWRTGDAVAEQGVRDRCF